MRPSLYGRPRVQLDGRKLALSSCRLRNSGSTERPRETIVLSADRVAEVAARGCQLRGQQPNRASTASLRRVTAPGQADPPDPSFRLEHRPTRGPLDRLLEVDEAQPHVDVLPAAQALGGASYRRDAAPLVYRICRCACRFEMPSRDACASTVDAGCCPHLGCTSALPGSVSLAPSPTRWLGLMRCGTRNRTPRPGRHRPGGRDTRPEALPFHHD